eukprot:TRINITY_DN7092_c1_g3_i1.p1 TRINITY_DN7092_c1_g3~~TRINITY_DN7092_c1_g3_i1.p1  ORF type:complete len:699 (-),score=126.65 TRINITY_DN7092_c1_g3_i1:35-2059(-)
MFYSKVVCCGVILWQLLLLQVYAQQVVSECFENIDLLIDECPELPELENLRQAQILRSTPLTGESAFSQGCCQALATLNSERCFCVPQLLEAFTEATSEEEFLPSLLFQASQVAPAGCSIPVFASLEGEACEAFGNTVFPQVVEQTEEEQCTDNLISEVIASEDNLVFFQEALDLLDLVAQLDFFNPVTVLAPTDQAFDTWATRQGQTVGDLLSQESSLNSLILKHIVLNFNANAETVPAEGTIQVAEDETLVNFTLESNGGIAAQGVSLKQSARSACNGAVYLVDQVLDGTQLAPVRVVVGLEDEPVALPAPEEIPMVLAPAPSPESPPPPQPSPPSPVVVEPSPEPEAEAASSGAVLPAFLPPDDVATKDANPDAVVDPTAPAVQIEQVPVVEIPQPTSVEPVRTTQPAVDPLVAGSGAVCEENLLEIMSGFLQLFNEFLSVVNILGLEGLIETQPELTLLVPVNDAFSNEENVDNWDPQNHIIVGKLTLEDLAASSGTTLETLSGPVLVETLPNGTVVVGGAQVIQGDVEGCNGYIHVLDNLIQNDQIALAPITAVTAEPLPDVDVSVEPTPSPSPEVETAPEPVIEPVPEPLPIVPALVTSLPEVNLTIEDLPQVQPSPEVEEPSSQPTTLGPIFDLLNVKVPSSEGLDIAIPSPSPEPSPPPSPMPSQF